MATDKLNFFNIIILVLSVYVLGALLVDTSMKLPPETSRLLNYIDNTICGIFFIDFSVRFYKAEDKRRFMRWGWIDLLSCIPVVDFLRTDACCA